jgi:hypothetical protein
MNRINRKSNNKNCIGGEKKIGFERKLLWEPESVHFECETQKLYTIPPFMWFRGIKKCFLN